MSFICHIYIYTEYNQRWNTFSAFNPSKWKHTRSSGQPTLRRPGSSWGSGALFKGLTSVVDNPCRSRDLNPRPRVTSPTLYPLEPRLPLLVLVVVKLCLIFVRAFNISHFHENGLGCVLPRQRGYTIQFANSSQFHWRYLLSQRWLGFQVNPLCRHDITSPFPDWVTFVT